MTHVPPQYYLYILLCDHEFLYTGIALDPSERVQQHRKGKPHGAKYTRRFSHLDLVYQVKIGSRSAAQKFEYHLKKCAKSKKLNIINNQPTKHELCELLPSINLD
ncbi:GIY-YIG nuclease family protein [Marinicella litoralis]|uniref:Putative endonuclease n=1 Tax=Marinicella litoralis TaxID=644220 RepID=A0A4R6XS24_9GAMM|nr:GIY-YIG nuclease family protein [Marinicella litoralis]TDR20824.1 putative endonuclease [Marinicella litoralis]